MNGFEALTLAPIDRRLIDVSLLSPAEIDWLNAYHARVAREVRGQLDDATRAWLDQATAPLK
jgi:Xaa-Pro aminopeptidase